MNTHLPLLLASSLLLVGCASTNPTAKKDNGIPYQPIIIPDGAPVLVKFEPEWITCDQDPGFGSAVLTDAQVAVLKSEFKQKTKSHINSLPTITTRLGQTGTIEIIRQWLFDADQTKPDWFGTRIQITADPSPSGALVGLKYDQHVLHHNDEELSLTLAEFPNSSTASRRAERGWKRVRNKAIQTQYQNVSPKDLLTRSGKLKHHAHDGTWFVIKAQGTSRKTDYLFCRIYRTDATGRPYYKAITPRKE